MRFAKDLPGSRVRVVVGYDYEKIVCSYPNLNFSYVLNWEKGNPLQFFLEASHDLTGLVIAMYGDTIFHPENIAHFADIEGDVVIAVGGAWKWRFKGRSEKDISIAQFLLKA